MPTIPEKTTPYEPTEDMNQLMEINQRFFHAVHQHFFERGARLKRESPEIYKAFKEFYKLDPAMWKKRIV